MSACPCDCSLIVVIVNSEPTFSGVQTPETTSQDISFVYEGVSNVIICLAMLIIPSLHFETVIVPWQRM